MECGNCLLESSLLMKTEFLNIYALFDEDIVYVNVVAKSTNYTHLM